MSKKPGNCPRGGDHSPGIAKREGDEIVHYCRKCGAELDRRPGRRKVPA